jgi:GT2 family glycosyltransferase
MQNPINLSIIIVNCNTRQLLANCIGSIINSQKTSKLTYEIIVVDNNSRDDSVEYIARKYPDVQFILNDTNAGFGVANNQGINKARGDYILLLNSDTETANLSIDRMYKYTSQKPKAIVGGKLMNPDKTPQSSCGPFFTLPVVFAALFLKGDKIGLTRYSPNKPRQVDWVSGACVMAAKKIFMDDLLFDEKIFMYMEDMDLMYRAKKKGYHVCFYPFSKFMHIGSGSSVTRNKQPVLNIYRGLLYFYAKHYPPIAGFILKMLLKLKAVCAWIIGTVTGDNYLTDTYGQAFQLV